MKLKALLVLAGLVVSCVLLDPAAAQTGENPDLPGNLIYRRASETSEDIVSLTADGQSIFQVPDDSCTYVSPDGLLTATAPETGGDILVQRLATEAIVRQIGRQTTWSPCFFYWVDDTTLRVKTTTSAESYVDIDVMTGSMSDYVVPPYIPPTYAQLPDRFGGQPVLPSPNGRFYFYERCLGPDSVTTSTNEVLCAEESDWALYDATTQQLLLTTTTPAHVYFDLRPFASASYATWDGVQWSSDSRYLAYVESHREWRRFALRIVDTTTGDFVPLSFFSVDVDAQRSLYWSPNNQKLAFWVLADLNDIESDSREHTLVMLDLSTNTFVYADEARTPLYGLWAPDSSAFAYLDLEYNLLLVDAATGTTRHLDANVTQLELWAPLLETGSTQTGPDSSQRQ